eukprot:TRINITY_DN43974_c0_g1_i1.p1 TRINITY_DN43974_c0_g1~~TRINITY_DN43974_c0_g1_i1.p1  ORF type:complete len:350 (+),score=66.97 TRINITY_DN43974_c0_g1_i1:81-1130(+)
MELFQPLSSDTRDDKNRRLLDWSPETTASQWSHLADIQPATSPSPSRERSKVINAPLIAKLGLVGFLENAVEKAESCTFLTLAENHIGDDGARMIREVLSSRPHCIRRMSLLRTGLGYDGLVEIGRLLPSCPVLETLILSGNDFSVCGGAGEALAVFCDHLLQAPELRALHLAHTRLNSQIVRPLCAALRSEAWRIELLDLSHNDLDASVMCELGESLHANSYLRTLNLTANKLGFKGGEALAAGLSKSPDSALRRLGVDRNALELRGCSAIARIWADKVGPQLDLLDLRENKLTEAGCKELCRMFRHPPDWTLEFGSRQVRISWPSKQGTVVQKTWQGGQPSNVFWYN